MVQKLNSSFSQSYLLPQSIKSQGECILEFLDAMTGKGLDFRGNIIANGEIQRFASGNKGNKNCWYVFQGTSGAFGDWSRGISEKWSLASGLTSLPINYDPRLKSTLEGTINQRQERAALISSNKWASSPVIGCSPYLTRKKVEAFGVRFDQDSLIVPLWDVGGKLWSLQWIAADGTKRFLPGGRKKGCFHHIGTFEEEKPIYVVEGYATGASVYTATRQTTAIAFDVGNLEPVIEELKKAYPANPIIIAGDDDIWKATNVGRQKAEQAARKYGCALAFPQFKDKGSKLTDFNDLHVLEGLDEVKTQLERAQHLAENETDPAPVNSSLLPVLPFTLDMLPEALQSWIKDIAYRKQCPLDFVAIPAIIMLASLVGARCSIKPHEKDDWAIVPNLWGGILGDPGTLKSPVCSEVLFPLKHLERRAQEDYQKRKTSYEAEKAVFQETRGALERKIKDTVEKITENPLVADESALAALKEKLETLLQNAPAEPAYTRYKVSDTTVEKMHEILSHNPKGVLVYRDELMGFLESWEKKGHETDRSFYLEAWNGDNDHAIDRIGRGTVYAQNICVSLLGTTQPDKIVSYLQKAITKLDNDGLLQRFQLLVYPDPKPWKLIDELPNGSAKSRIFEICKAINTMKFTDHGAIEPQFVCEGEYVIPFFRLAPDAQKFSHGWLNTLQAKLEAKDHPIITQHLSKYRSLMPSLALIFHVVDLADGKRERNVTLGSVQKAVAWCAYLEFHARRIYGMILDTTFETKPTSSKVDDLLAWMRKQAKHSDQPLKRRFILRYSKFRSSKELDPLLSDLIQMGYIQESPQGGFSVVL